ncbi:hypothetical protein C4573_03535 [Candidatus Woesearchaeota archaeon]|nr:MAG: hypothetical protein C4573_03535 [Candidatus Woesearchaeota archaeon]
MKRKLIKQGMSGFTIYLPKKWIDRKGLKAGDEISIEESQTGLIIDATLKEKKQITIEITEENKHDLKNILTHAYRAGFDTIILKGLITENQIKLPLLLGFEITEKENQKITLESISEPEENKYDVLLKRTFFIIKETQKITINDLQTGLKNFKQIEELTLQSDRYVLFCRRSIQKELAKQQMLNWELLTFLMHIQHAYFYLYQYAEKNYKKNPEIIQLLKDLEIYFDLFYNAFYTKKMAYIHKINSQKNSYQEACRKALTKGKDAIIISHIRELFRLIQIGTSPVLAILLSETYSM